MTSDLAKLMEKIDLLQAENIPEPVIETEETKVHPLLQAFNELKEEGIVESLEIDIEEEIAYHGTVDDIQQFHPFTHFGTEKAAKDRMEYKKIKDGKIYKVDLDIKNPLTIKDFPGIHYDRLYAFELKDKRLISQEEMEEITFTQDPKELRNKLLNKLNELGIDGFVYKNKYEDKGNISYVIVDPSQVKVLSVEPAAEVVPEAIDRVKGGWKHHGLGYRQDPKTWEYPVHPLPKWHKFSSYNRNEKGSWEDIIHYMIFTINDYATYSLDLTGDEIAKTICKLHGTNPNEELKKANIFYRRSKDPLSWSEIYTALKENTVEQDVKRLQREGLDEASPNTLKGSFSKDLVKSKKWLTKLLTTALKNKNPGTIYVLGSWYGNIGLYLDQAGVKFDKLVLIDPDKEALEQSKDLLSKLVDENRLTLINKKAEDVEYKKPGIIINTSCNETGPLFLHKVPEKMLCVLQARNNVDNVLITIDNLEEFVEFFPLQKTYYTGKKELSDPETEYNRYMVIGRAGKKLDETVSTGLGGGSAGNVGGSMVGGPTTYEQEYDMFKSKGPRRITAMTNEALDSSYPYEGKAISGRYTFETEDGVFYKVYFGGKDLVEVAFSAILPGEEENFRPDKTTLTGTGNSRKVFGTVVKIVKEFLEEIEPKALYFTGEGSEPSRIKLYDRLLSQVDKELPNYYAANTVDLGSGKAYMLRRKEENVTEALDSSYDYRTSDKNPGRVFYFDTIDGSEYKVQFSKAGKAVELSFYARGQGDEHKIGLTGSGDSRKIFGTVINIVKDYLTTNTPNTLLFTASNSEPSRVKLYKVLASKVDQSLPDYTFQGAFNNGNFTQYNIIQKNSSRSAKLDVAKGMKNRALNAMFESTISLADIYDGSYPDSDEHIWNYVGDSDFDIPFEISTMQPVVLEQILCNQYGVDDIEELFDKMQPEQEEIVKYYKKDPNLSQQVIVLYQDRIIDGNHRAVAAVLAHKPIRYIDISEDNEQLA